MARDTLINYTSDRKVSSPSERRYFEAWDRISLSKIPSDILAELIEVRVSTKAEDSHGIDAVIKFDNAPDLRKQIKRNEAGKQAFLKTIKNDPGRISIVVQIVAPNDDLEDIIKEALQIIANHLAKQSKPDNT